MRDFYLKSLLQASGYDKKELMLKHENFYQAIDE